jgi:Tfp pilus assembly protein PilV
MCYSSNPRSCNRASASSGSSLIEVMLAVALMAVTTLGLIAGQLWTAREARAMALREQAAWIADSVAEAMRTPASANAATRQWNSRATRFCRMGKRPQATALAWPSRESRGHLSGTTRLTAK